VNRYPSAVTQACPNCGRAHDVSVYVSGQTVTCGCGIRFDVVRTDVRASMVGDKEGRQTVAGKGPVAADAAPTPESETPPIGSSSTGNEATVARTGSVPAAAPSVKPELPGYVLGELLGRGGMGEVWKGRQVSLDREVAVKVLPEKFSKDPEFVARFEKETKALASLSHPNIVQIIDRGKAGDHYFFAMELVPGVTLREMLHGPLPQRDALRIAAQIARAIDSAHEKLIVHRDLKPENILVDARGHVKIADFGLAGMNGSKHNLSLTATAVAMGTVNYMAPEQRRDAKHVDHRADLYSLGVLLYEMLTGELPIGRFKLPSQKIAGLDPAIDELVAQLLETEPDARPKRALDIALALEALTPVSGVGSPSRPPAGSAPAIPGAASGWRTGAIVLGALLLMGVALKLWPATPGGPSAPTALPAWYEDSEDEFFSSFTFTKGVLKIDFSASIDAGAPGGEEFNTHTGVWAIRNGVLEAVQYGDPVEDDHLLPRAYVAHRYFSSDDFEAGVDVELAPVGPEFPPLDEKAQRFAELAFRIKDLQVSVFAIPGANMRVGWRYFTRDGQEHTGNTAEQVDDLVEDSMRVPKGPFRMSLKLTGLKGGDVNVEASVNGSRFSRKVLPGLGGQIGKVAIGCRNSSCHFDNLTVQGKVMPGADGAKGANGSSRQ
jgi:serine/threonine protein kinase